MVSFQDGHPSTKRLTADERGARNATWLKIIRFRSAIGRELDFRGIKAPAAVGEALGLDASDARDLLTRRQWRDDDLKRLALAAERLGVAVSDEDPSW